MGKQEVDDCPRWDDASFVLLFRGYEARCMQLMVTEEKECRLCVDGVGPITRKIRPERTDHDRESRCVQHTPRLLEASEVPCMKLMSQRTCLR